jgi:hypothetical protein
MATFNEALAPNKWHTHKVCLPKGTYSVGFIGMLGKSENNSIGLDNVKLLGECIYSGKSISGQYGQS